jgi:hypothetical protein
MDYAKDAFSGKIVAAQNAFRGHRYVCPRPGCGGQVYLPEVHIQRPHFRHYPREGTPECDQYHPGTYTASGATTTTLAEVEEDPSELGLLLTQLDGIWGLGLRLPEIPGDELGDGTLHELRSAYIEICAGQKLFLKVSALDLRPGVGAARVDVVPSIQEFSTEPEGVWPETIDKERWHLKSRGLEVKGTLFRLRCGEWTRLRAGSGVHQGETLILLADARCAPPDSVVTQACAHISSTSIHWTIWEVHFPSEDIDSISIWLKRLGHELLPRPWSVELATPPHAYNERDEPVFWVGDSPIFTLEAPSCGSEALASCTIGTNSFRTIVKASEENIAHIIVGSVNTALARLDVDTELNASFDICFAQKPSRAALLQLLAETPRMRVFLGELCIEAWRGASHRISITPHELPEVRIDLGADNVRISLTLWERGKQRSSRGLACSDAERIVRAALSTASRIELEADNFGHIEIVPVLTAVDTPREDFAGSRLAWHNHVSSLSTHIEEPVSPSLLVQPRSETSLVMRLVGAAPLIRARLDLRRRKKEVGGARS